MIFDYISKVSDLPFSQQVTTNFTSELQWSPNFQIGIVLEGSVSIHYEKHTRELMLHDIMFFLPMQTFSFVGSADRARVLFLTVDSAFISQLCPELNRLSLSQNHLRANLSNEIYAALCRDFSILIFNNLKQELCTRMKLLNAATHMVSTIFEQFGVLSLQESSQAVSDRRAEILNYISDHYAEKISIADIAGHLGLHPQYFSAYFRKQFSTTFIDYLTGYRVNHSIYNLAYTDESVLNIALNHGFNSHKTYTLAFKKLYGCTPMEYRHSYHRSGNASARQQEEAEEVSGASQFSFFRQFTQPDRLLLQGEGMEARTRSGQSLVFDTSRLFSSARDYDGLKMISSGRAFTCLRSEVQKQIRQAKEDLDFDYVRVRDIFSDDLFVYYEDENKKARYNWGSLDNIFDFILSIGCIPFPEIGFMPNLLASKRQYAGVNYHPNVSMPKSMTAWKELVRTFLLHIVERYGLAEVEKWYFDFWTCPDLQIKNAYWNESMEDFFALYQATYEAFQSVSSTQRPGSANFSAISGYPWYEAFFQFCFARHLRPSHVSFHGYGSEVIAGSDLVDTFMQIPRNMVSVSDPDFILRSIRTLRQIMDRNGFRDLDIIVSDWNLSFLPKDMLRDTCYMGPYIAHVQLETTGLVKGMSFCTLSDIHEDAFPDSELFTGGPGLLDYHSLKKSSYNTMVLLSQLGDRVLSRGNNYIFTQRGPRYQILVYNLAKFDPMFSPVDPMAVDRNHRYQIYDSENLSFSITLNLPSGTYYVKRSEVNRAHGSAYDLWNAVGAPETLSREFEDYLRTNSAPHVTFSVEKADRVLVLDEEVPAHGVLLIELIPKG